MLPPVTTQIQWMGLLPTSSLKILKRQAKCQVQQSTSEAQLHTHAPAHLVDGLPVKRAVWFCEQEEVLNLIHQNEVRHIMWEEVHERLKARDDVTVLTNTLHLREAQTNSLSEQLVEKRKQEAGLAILAVEPICGESENASLRLAPNTKKLIFCYQSRQYFRQHQHLPCLCILNKSATRRLLARQAPKHTLGVPVMVIDTAVSSFAVITPIHLLRTVLSQRNTCDVTARSASTKNARGPEPRGPR
jgi:hypothetical protein